MLIGSRAKITRDDRDSEPYKVTYDIVVMTMLRKLGKSGNANMQ